MKTFAIALTVLGLAVASGQADTFRDRLDHERQEDDFVVAQGASTVEVPAGTVMAAEDLINEHLSARDLVRVTVIPSTGVIDTGQ